jgi:hypothetical protein
VRVVGFWRAFAAENAPWGGGSVLKSESLRCITTACRGMYEPLKGRAATASQPRRTHARNEILDFVTCCCWCTRESSRGDLTHILSANCPRTATKTTQIEPTNQSLCHWFCVALLHDVGWSWGRFFPTNQKAGSSNLSGRTITYHVLRLPSPEPEIGPLLYRLHRRFDSTSGLAVSRTTSAS